MRDPVPRGILRQSYDRSAGAYDRKFEALQEPKYRALLARLPLPEGRILDAGCGTGLLAARLAPRPVVGLDLSFGMLALAQGRVAGRVQGDVTALPFAGKSFVAVFAVTALLVPAAELPCALAELARVLTPGGVLGLTILKHDVAADLEARLAGAGFSLTAARFDAGQDWGWTAARR